MSKLEDNMYNVYNALNIHKGKNRLDTRIFLEHEYNIYIENGGTKPLEYFEKNLNNFIEYAKL